MFGVNNHHFIKNAIIVIIEESKSLILKWRIYEYDKIENQNFNKMNILILSNYKKYISFILIPIKKNQFLFHLFQKRVLLYNPLFYKI